MLVARRTQVPVGLVRFADRPDSYSVVVKLTYDLSKGGWAKRLPDSDPLSGDLFDDREGRVYPSDFSPAKLTCDVLVVGEILGDDRASPAKLRAASLLKTVETAALLGPLAADPTDTLAQDAPLDQRIPWPRLPMEIGVELGTVRIDAIIPGPIPSAALVFGGQLSSALALELHVDGVLIDPVDRTCSLTFRGCFQHGGSVHRDLLIVVDAGSSLASVTIDEVERWPRVPVELDPATFAEASIALGSPAPDLALDAPSEDREPPEDEGSPTEEQDEEPPPESVTDVRGLESRQEPDPMTQPPGLSTRELAIVAEEATPALPFLKPLHHPDDPQSDIDTPSSRRPLMVIGPVGTPLAYPPVPFASPPTSAGEDEPPPPSNRERQREP